MSIRLTGVVVVLLLAGCAGVSPCPQGPTPGVDFAGEWDSEWGRVRLSQQEHRAAGTYTYLAEDQPIEGRLEGVVSGRTFRFRWSEREEAGFGWFALTGDGQGFVGEWWSDGAAESQGWHGVRRSP